MSIIIAAALAMSACGRPAAPRAPERPTGTPFAVVAAVTAIPVAPEAEPTLAAQATQTAVTTPISAAVVMTPDAVAEPTPISTELRQQIFTEVWETIEINYLYADFRGVDWASVREEFASQVASATSDEEFYSLLSDMVIRLNDNHSRFLAPSAAQKEDVRTSGREEQVGIGVITLPLSDALLIQHVFPNSPAERAGLRQRDRIVAIDGQYFARRDIEGSEGSRVRLTVVRPGEESRDVVITRQLVEGRIEPGIRRLPGDIGYLEVTTLWVGDMADLVAASLQSLTVERPLRGLIIDLRHNPGGWRDVLTGMLGHFVRGPVGEFFSRQSTVSLTIEAGAKPDLRDLPLVVLIDSGTASYAELLAGILQREAGAIVIGNPSAGNTETIYAYELSGGARLWVAQEGFRLRDGENLEGIGVQPNVRLSQDWTRFSEESDPWILEGIRQLQAAGKQ